MSWNVYRVFPSVGLILLINESQHLLKFTNKNVKLLIKEVCTTWCTGFDLTTVYPFLVLETLILLWDLDKTNQETE